MGRAFGQRRAQKGAKDGPDPLAPSQEKLEKPTWPALAPCWPLWVHLVGLGWAVLSSPSLGEPPISSSTTAVALGMGLGIKKM